MTQTPAQTPPFLMPFVLPMDPVVPVRDGAVDWYLPEGDLPARVAAVVFVHGGPLPSWVEPKPRGWPVYQGYGAWAARAGLVGVTFDHGFSGYDAFDQAQRDIVDVVAAVLSHPRVDPERVVLWGFSGAGMLLGRWIRERPAWLRGVAATYPCCRPLEEVTPPPVSMAEAVASAGDLPLLLTRVGLERDEVAETVTELMTAIEASDVRLEVIDVPDGHHGFDHVDPGEQSRQAVQAAMAWVQDRLR